MAVLSIDQGSRRDIPIWMEKAKHELVGIETLDGYERIVVNKLH